MRKNQNKNSLHTPVLLEEVLSYLAPKKGETYLDLTAGYGGHAKAVLERTQNPTGAVLVDRDKNAVKNLRQKFLDRKTTILHQDFWKASQKLASEDRKFDMILADLGVSSPHFNEAHRGFAIDKAGPLDMRMDESQSLTAERVVNTYSEKDLAILISRYGEEPKAKQIAKIIVQSRPIISTTELAAVVAKAWPGRSRVHPATRTFQAIRIAVNDELNLLENSLPLWVRLLNPGGRLVVISFHSLEDRIVKQAFGEYGGERYDATLAPLTNGPITSGQNELVFNPRARSAKLRAVAKK